MFQQLRCLTSTAPRRRKGHTNPEFRNPRRRPALSSGTFLSVSFWWCCSPLKIRRVFGFSPCRGGFSCRFFSLLWFRVLWLFPCSCFGRFGIPGNILFLTIIVTIFFFLKHPDFWKKVKRVSRVLFTWMTLRFGFVFFMLFWAAWSSSSTTSGFFDWSSSGVNVFSSEESSGMSCSLSWAN